LDAGSTDASPATSGSADAVVGGDALADSTAAGEAGNDAGALSFAADVYPIITSRCIACHTPSGAGVVQGHLDMTTNLATGAYRQLMMRAMGTVAGGAATTCAASGLTRVVPGSAATSLFYNKVNSKLSGVPALCGNPMPNPTAAPPLMTSEVVTIQNWIDQGARP